MALTRSPIRTPLAAAACLIALAAAGCDERDAERASATTPAAGGSIAYEKEVGADKQLFSARPDGTGERRLTDVDGDAVHPDWSPDGKRIVVTTHAHFVLPGESANVVAIHPDGMVASRITRFTGGEKNAFAGSFSPDGKQIVLRLERGGTYGLATVDRDGRNLRAPAASGPEQPRYIDWGA